MHPGSQETGGSLPGYLEPQSRGHLKYFSISLQGIIVHTLIHPFTHYTLQYLYMPIRLLCMYSDSGKK